MAPSHVARRLRHTGLAANEVFYFWQCHRRTCSPNPEQCPGDFGRRGTCRRELYQQGVSDRSLRHQSRRSRGRQRRCAGKRQFDDAVRLAEPRFLSRRRPSPCWRALHPAMLPETLLRSAHWWRRWRRLAIDLYVVDHRHTARPVTFSDNGTNTAKNTTATFTMPGFTTSSSPSATPAARPSRMP